MSYFTALTFSVQTLAAYLGKNLPNFILDLSFWLFFPKARGERIWKELALFVVSNGNACTCRLIFANSVKSYILRLNLIFLLSSYTYEHFEFLLNTWLFDQVYSYM